MKITMQIAGVLALGLIAPGAALASSACPAYGVATDCTTIITATSSGLTVTGGPGGTTYDGSDDQLVGFYNNSSSSVSSFQLNGGTIDIFGFEGDGIDTYGAPGNSTDNSAANIAAGTAGYGGPDSYFTNISSDYTSGTVNFVTPIAPGGTTYFSLEEAYTAGSIVVTPGGPSVAPEPSTFLLLGTGAAGVLTSLRRRLFA